MLAVTELQRIKESIVNENKLILETSGEIIKLPEEVNLNINCYAYSLGIMRPADSYIPGFTTSQIYDENLIDSFILNICKDLENLEIKYRKFKVNDEIKLNEKEYLVQALFLPDSSDLWIYSAFHFSRMNKKKKWFAKQGWIEQPCFEKVKVINKFDDFEIVEVTSVNCIRKYFRVAYFAIEEKQ